MHIKIWNTPQTSPYLSFFKQAILLLAWLGFSMACSLLTPVQESVTLDGCYQITFLGMSQNTDKVSTWRYHVEEQACAQDLSNWMLELPARPWEIVQPDPNYQLNGLKWQTDAGFERGDFSVVLSGELMAGAVRVGVKGPDVAIGEIKPSPLPATVMQWRSAAMRM
jgi:hypothetical protein